MAQNRTQPQQSESTEAAVPTGFRAIGPEEREAAEPTKTEPTMRSLRRILGDGVLDIFPDGMTDLVDQAHAYWQQHPEKWLEAEYDTALERDDSFALMRAYAECAGQYGYTIRQDKTAEPHVLRFRVTKRRGSGSDDN